MERLKKNRVERAYFPAGNKIVVRRNKQSDRTEGGLFRPDIAKAPEFSGEVIAVGPDARGIEIGDKVVYGGFYQMLAPKSHDDNLIVLKYPDEVMYSYQERTVQVDESDEEFNERQAAERLRQERMILVGGGG